MTVLVISYKKALNDGVELMYSLRSIEKNLHMPDLEVVIVGDTPPTWLKADLHIPVQPLESLGKASNISRAVWFGARALGTEGVEDFIYLDDDYFLLDPTDSVMLVHGGLLDAHLARCRRQLRSGHWFTAAMAHTSNALVNEQPNLVSFELHRPLPVDVDEAIELLERIQDTEVFWRTWYGNLCDDRPQAVEGHDGRYIGKSLPAGAPWVSSEDRAWADWLGKKISTLFPVPSKWER